MDMKWYMPVRVFGGEGCLKQNAALLRKLGRRCVLVIGGNSVQKNGVLDEVLSILKEQDIDVTVYSGVLPNPPVYQCREIACAAQVCRAEFLVALGGGSVMDAAKAAACLAANSVSNTEALFRGELRHPALPLVVIGTTAGTGSEVTRVGVLTRDDTGRKQSFRHDSCFPRYAFADPRYTATMPRDVTISSALDALSHAVEGWFSPHADAMSRLCGGEAIRTILAELDTLAAHADAVPDAAGRERLLYASLWAGMSLNMAGVAFPHTMGYALTEEHGVPHGMACAVLLPAFLRQAAQHAPQAAAELYDVCGGRERLFSLLDTFTAIPLDLSDEQIESYVARYEPTPNNFLCTPGTFTAVEAGEVFRRVAASHQSGKQE